MADVVKPRVRVRVSKNKKKSWGKFSDIKDVEAFLEEKRFEERIGGAVSEKRDDELFFIHTEKDAAEFKAKLSKIAGLKCHQSLTAYSKVAPPVKPSVCGKKQNTLNSSIQKKHLEKVIESLAKPKKKTQKPQFHDLWNDDDKKKPDPEIQELIDYRDEIMKKKPVKVPAHLYQKPSLLPAVEIPHPGSSYNPVYEDHQDLLREATVIEVKKVKHDMHLKRILTDMFPSKEDAPTEKTWLSEMSQGLFEDGTTETANDVELPHVGLSLTLNPPVTTETRKTKSQKRKAKEQRAMDKERVDEKTKKRELNNVFRIRSLLSELRTEDELSKQKQAKREEREISKLFNPRTLSAYKYEPKDLEVKLTSELTDSLRGLKAEGSVLEDRYKSLQRRNIIETRIKQKRMRKYKLKFQVKRSHRDFK